MEHAIDELEQLQLNSKFVKEAVVVKALTQKLLLFGASKSKQALSKFNIFLANDPDFLAKMEGQQLLLEISNNLNIPQYDVIRVYKRMTDVKLSNDRELQNISIAEVFHARNLLRKVFS